MEQIEVLAAHCRAPDKQDMPLALDVKVSSCLEDVGKHKPAKATGFCGRINAIGIRSDAAHQDLSVGRNYAVFGRNCTVSAKRGRPSSKFTPNWENKGDNNSANWRQDWNLDVPSLQPMKITEQGASVINMPSLIQGQAFSDVPPLQLSVRSISQPAAYSPTPPPSDCGSLRGQGAGTGWKRGAHSATMYTRYRSPEFALMYIDLEPSSSTDTTSCVQASKNSESRKFDKLR